MKRGQSPAEPTSEPAPALTPMLNTLNDILNASSFAYMVTGGLTILTAMLIKAMSSSTALALSFVPALAFGGLSGLYVSREFGVLLLADQEANVVLAVGAGTIVALLLMVLVTRISYAATEIRKPVTHSR